MPSGGKGKRRRGRELVEWKNGKEKKRGGGRNEMFSKTRVKRERGKVRQMSPSNFEGRRGRQRRKGEKGGKRLER